MLTFKQFLMEGNPLSRFHSLQQKGHTSFTVSPHRQSRTPEENAKAMKRTKRYLARKKVGYRNTEGKWNEGDGVAKEPSMHVISKGADRRSERRTERAVKHVAKREKQDAYIKVDKHGTGTAHYTNKTSDHKKGDKVEYGKAHYNQDNPYGETRYKPGKNKFTFK
jgi:hypothetical protein